MEKSSWTPILPPGKNGDWKQRSFVRRSEPHPQSPQIVALTRQRFEASLPSSSPSPVFILSFFVSLSCLHPFLLLLPLLSSSLPSSSPSPVFITLPLPRLPCPAPSPRVPHSHSPAARAGARVCLPLGHGEHSGGPLRGSLSESPSASSRCWMKDSRVRFPASQGGIMHPGCTLVGNCGAPSLEVSPYNLSVYTPSRARAHTHTRPSSGSARLQSLVQHLAPPRLSGGRMAPSRCAILHGHPLRPWLGAIS
jgi:hypothetical protein